jgi:elongation factor G
LQAKAEEFRATLLEAVAETDDALMEKFFAGEEISVDEIHEAIRKATVRNDIVPVICGSSYKNKGVQPMLDAVVRYLPSPLDIPDVVGIDPRTDESTRAIRLRTIRLPRWRSKSCPTSSAP